MTSIPSKHPLPQSLVHISMMTFKERRQHICPRGACAQIQWQKHYTNLKHLLHQSIAHKINVETLKEKYKKSLSTCPATYVSTKSMIKYTSYKNLRNLLRQLLSCKISYKIQLKNSKYLPPQSLACEVYRKQENEVKYLLPQSRSTGKINDKNATKASKKSFLAVTSAPNQR